MPEEIAAENGEFPAEIRKRLRTGPARRKIDYAEIKKLKKIKALMNNPTLTAAFLEVYPNAKRSSVRANGKIQMLTPDVFDEVIKLLKLDATVTANKDVLEKVLFMVVARWMSKEEKTSDMIAAVRELTKLVPEFKDKLQVEDISQATEEELDRKLRSFGYDPTRLN